MITTESKKVKHRHHDAIIGWANGEVIQFQRNLLEGWCDFEDGQEPRWLKDVGLAYRIKPPAPPKTYARMYKNTQGGIGVVISPDLWFSLDSLTWIGDWQEVPV